MCVDHGNDYTNLMKSPAAVTNLGSNPMKSHHDVFRVCLSRPVNDASGRILLNCVTVSNPT